MDSEDRQETETTWMAQAPVGTIGSTNANQEMADNSWEWRTCRHYKERFLQSKCFWPCTLLGIILVGTIIALVLKLQTSAQHCPSEWIGYNKKCYFISQEEQKNWTSSQTFCSNSESLLITFENQEEMRSLVERLRTDDSWIGLRKKGESFYWENGIALKADSFQIWNHSECAYLYGSTIFTSACSLPRRWICVQPLKAMR